MSTMTIADLWREAVAETRDYPAYLVEENGSWQAVGWAEAAGRVDELAAGFLALGIERGDRVSILGRTRLEWSLCDFALISIGAIVVPIYPTSSTEDCVYILENSGARGIICEDADQLARISARRSELPSLEWLLTMVGVDRDELCVDELGERGRAFLRERPSAVADARGLIRETDVMTILYTSGTTGPPKGCMIQQRHFRMMAEKIREIDLVEPGERALLYLPLAHNIGRLVQYITAAVGVTLAFCPDVADIPKSLLAVRPNLFPSVPRVFEKVHAAVRAKFDESAGLRRLLINWALDAGYRASECRQQGLPLPPVLRVQYRLADLLVFRKIKARMGGRIRIAISGGAPLAKEIVEFFHAIGVSILEGYGLTECTTASHLNRPDRYRLGTVGPPLPGVEARVAEDGEILLQSDTIFAGYFQDEAATRAVLTDDGWLRTGDIGEIDADGFLTVTDRKKDLIITAGGKNVGPANIENALKAVPYILEALVVGDRRPYLVALIALDTVEMEQHSVSPDEADAVIEQAVREVNANLGRVEQIKRFAILPRAFDADAGEVTPTLKLRRRVCEEHFREEIESLYASGSTAPLAHG